MYPQGYMYPSWGIPALKRPPRYPDCDRSLAVTKLLIELCAQHDHMSADNW